jgi:signal transduction histidine kinase
MRGQPTAYRIDPESAEAHDGSAKLDQVLAKLERAVTSAQVARAVVQGGCVSAGATSGAVALLTSDRSDLKVIHVAGDVTRVAAAGGMIPLAARFPLTDVVRSGRELWLTDPQTLVENYPGYASLDGSTAWAALPVCIDGVVLGAAGWGFRHGWLSSHQRACLRSLAQAGGVAFYRAGLFDIERSARMQAELGNYHAVLHDRMMSAISSALDSSVDPNDISGSLQLVARLTLPCLGDWCSIQVLDDQGKLRNAAAVHADRGTERLLQRLLSGSAISARKLPRILANNKSLVQNLHPESVRGGVLTRRQAQVFRLVGLERILVLPLQIHGQTLGIIAFGSGRDSVRYVADDCALADRVARRCAAWLEYLRLHETAERAHQARENFVAATSHELRTPLSHIKGFVSTLRSQDIEWDADTQDDFLGEIEHEADRLTLLVETLLDLSQLDSTRLDRSQRAPTPPAALIESGIQRLGSSLGEHRVEVQASSDLPLVLAEATHIERVIANLLDNAAKYSPPADLIEIIMRISGHFVMFRVEDRGLGIPTEHIQRIFEPFFREPTGPYPAKPGTGLGLTICQSIIHSHRGRIWAEHRPGGGTAIVFTLPIAKGSQR